MKTATVKFTELNSNAELCDYASTSYRFQFST